MMALLYRRKVRKDEKFVCNYLNASFLGTYIPYNNRAKLIL